MITINAWSIVYAILIFGVLIFIHEFGHFTVARLFHVTVHEFSIGMGPKILKRTSKKTGITYALRALPIGGFVSMEGENDESEDENAFHRKPVWQRFLITAAGAAMNVLLGVLLMTILVSTSEVLPSNVIGAFDYNEDGVCYSESAGLMIGDEFYSVGGTRVHVANETVYEIMMQGIEPVDITVIRNGEKVTIKDVLFGSETESGVRYGVADFRVTPEAKTLGNVLKHAWFRSTSTIKMIWESLIMLLRGRYGLEAVSGPVGVTKAIGEAAQAGFTNLVYLTVVISMNLGVMNLLPLPALDGGRLVFQIIEMIRRKPVPVKVEGIIHMVGLVLLLILMVVVAVKDVIGLF